LPSLLSPASSTRNRSTRARCRLAREVWIIELFRTYRQLTYSFKINGARHRSRHVRCCARKPHQGDRRPLTQTPARQYVLSAAIFYDSDPYSLQDSLAYSCVCGNGISPNASQYSQTIPYFLCTQSNTNCVNNCGGDSTCQSSCRDDNPCGAQNPTRVNTSTISTMSATATGGSAASGTGSGSGGQVFSGFGGSSGAASATATGSSNSKSSAPALVINVGPVYGLALVVASFLTGFALLL